MMRVMHQRQTAVVVLLSAMASCAVSAESLGQTGSGSAATAVVPANGTRMQAPLNRPVSRQSNLSLTIDTRWANGYGYRPIEVTITSPKPTTADHLVTVRLHSGWASTFNVEHDFEMPSGSTSATTIIAVPQYQSQLFWWEVWIDGTKDKDLSLSAEETINRFGANFGAPAGFSFLVGSFPARGGMGGQRDLMAPNTFEFEALSLGIAEFPGRWIDYTCFDVIALSWGELKVLSQVNPAASEAIERWLRAGGQLWVDQIGDEFQEIGDLSEFLGLRSSIADAVRRGDQAEGASESTEDSFDAGWQPVRFRRGIREGQVVTFLDITTGSSRVVRDPEVIAQLQVDPNFVVTDQQFESVEEDNEGRRWPRESSRWFVEQRLGLGRVRAFRESSDVALVLPGSQSTTTDTTAADGSNGWMPRGLATALRSTDKWVARHGLAPDDINRDFASLLVPGVGLAPVTEFRILITLFVLLIGPVNYWLLKRWRRLHLLVLTVPLAAALMTAALFAYAILSDGFGTTIRVRSFTALDQRSGEAACWAWLSYYSGLAPGEGLTMPADLVIYPIHPAWNAASIQTNLGGARDMIWEGDEAKLARGWLRSRTPTQYLTIRSRRTPHRLELAAGGGKLRATNELGAAIESVLVVDQAGELWAGEKLATSEVAFLDRIEHRDAIRRFRELVVENAPEPPAALSGDDSHYSVMQRRQWRSFGGRFGNQSGESRLEANLMNEAVAELAGLAGRPALALPPRSYVAVTATGPEVELGMPGAKEEASFHVIVGQW